MCKFCVSCQLVILPNLGMGCWLQLALFTGTYYSLRSSTARQTLDFLIPQPPLLGLSVPNLQSLHALKLPYLISICLQTLGELSTRQTIIRASLQTGALDVVSVNAPAGHIVQVCGDVVLGVIVPGARWISLNQYESVQISRDQSHF